MHQAWDCRVGSDDGGGGGGGVQWWIRVGDRFPANYAIFRETLQWLLHSNIRIECTVVFVFGSDSRSGWRSEFFRSGEGGIVQTLVSVRRLIGSKLFIILFLSILHFFHNF